MIFAVGMYERQLKTLTPEFERDSRQYFDEAFGRALHTGKTTQLRIVPVNKQIAVERGVTTYDRIRAHVEASPGPFGTLHCICRHGHDLLDEPCRQTKLRDNCLMIGPAARWAVDSGSGQAVTREQMLDLLDQADRDGLVLQPENTKAPMFVCCCCGCCCGVLRTAKRRPHPAEFLQLQLLRRGRRRSLPVLRGVRDALPDGGHRQPRGQGRGGPRAVHRLRAVPQHMSQWSAEARSRRSPHGAAGRH